MLAVASAVGGAEYGRRKVGRLLDELSGYMLGTTTRPVYQGPAFGLQIAGLRSTLAVRGELAQLASLEQAKSTISRGAKRPTTVIGVFALVVGVAYLIARTFSVPADPPDWALDSPLLYSFLPPAVLTFGIAWVGTYLHRLIRGDEPQKHTAGPEGLGSDFGEAITRPQRVVRRILGKEIRLLHERISRIENGFEELKERDRGADTLPDPGTKPKE